MTADPAGTGVPGTDSVGPDPSGPDRVGRDPVGPDPFGTEALRALVLAGWAASDLRFREDANAEEALALGGYADRALVELIANGVDAAVAGRVPGRVRVALAEGELRVANTGAPLTAGGVAGLATLRASAKRDQERSVGHFGVGFTAVRGITDAPRIVSTSGGVRFDASATAGAIAALSSPRLDDEVAARNGQVPALRLPWPVGPEEPGPPAGYVTEVRLPLRPDAVDAVRRQLAALGPWVFFALPGLAALEVEGPAVAGPVVEGPEPAGPEAGAPPTRRWERSDEAGTVRIGGDRYQVAGRSGQLPAALLADRPVEERRRTQWWLTWVRPCDGPPAGRLGAPTPTDEPLTLPADLYGTFPVDDTRRRLATGPLTDHLLEAAASAYVDLVGAVAPDERWRLAPPELFPAGPVDQALRHGVEAALAAAPVLRTALVDAVCPQDAVLVADLPGPAAPLLAQAVPGLLPAAVSGAQERALRRLGVTVLPLAEAVDALAGLHRPPSFWSAVYRALADAPTDALAGLPVPLVGGALRPGPRGVLLVEADAELVRRVVAEVPGLPVVDPEAADPLLTRLGATPADPAALLGHEALRRRYAAFRAELDDEDPDPAELDRLAGLALDLVRAAGGTPLADVVLTDADDEPWPAADLLAPDAPLAGVLAADADLPQVHRRWSDRYPPEVLSAVGVRIGLPVARLTDADLDLPDLDDWPGSGGAEDAAVLLDLDLVDPDRWPRYLELLGGDPAARAAVSDPRSYSSWWLRRFATVAGRPLGHHRRPGSGELAGLYPPLPVALDAALLAGLGIPASLAEVAADDPDDLLRRYADPHLVVPAVSVPALTAVVAGLVGDGRVDLPERVRTLAGTAVPADRAVVVDQPWWAQVLTPDEVVPGGADPAGVADRLELDLASEVLRAVVPDGDPRPDDPAAAAAAAALGVATVPLRYREGLSVRVGERSVRVRWWSSGAGLVTDGSPEGIGRAVAQAAGRWDARFLAEAAARGNGLSEFG